jgi:hypothetical protein
MKIETYNKIVRQYPTIFIAAVVTMLSNTLYETSKTSQSLFSASTWTIFLQIVLMVGIALGIVALAILIIYRLSNDPSQKRK